MLLSLNWLKQYLKKWPNISDDELRSRVSVSLAEVEDIKRVGELLEKIVVGKIRKIKPHPRSAKLSVTIVDTGEEQILRNIVCGASNIFEGAKVPVALPGGTVLNPKQKLGEQEAIKIEETEIGKVKSEGMLLSQKELGISDDHEGIFILSDDANIGDDFAALLKDTIFEIENKSLTNRPDCFSHIGIARELSAIFDIPFEYKESEEIQQPTQNLPLSISVKAKDLCKRYTAVAIKGVKVKPSPSYLVQKLISIGIRPVNNIVDATNYVMCDLGQPIHAFDHKKVKSGKIIVRKAKSRETITTLDDKERKLLKNNLLICDNAQPLGIAGVMGGKDSEVNENTKDIIIESANFEMFNIRKTSLELGLRTDASTRFEKGLDPNLAIVGLRSVVSLIQEIAGGEVASEVIDVYPNPVEEQIIEVDTSDVLRLIGIKLSKEEILAILKLLHLGITEQEASKTKIKIKVPTFRQDLHIKEDILEEIARIYGYDKLKPTLPEKTLKPALQNRKREFVKKIKLAMTALGFDEMYTYSFIGEEQYKNTLLAIKDCKKLKNPISPELAYVRTSLVPSLLEKLKMNQMNSDEVSLFEVSRVYFRKLSKEKLPHQPKILTCIKNSSKPDHELFFDLKGDLEAFFEKLKIGNVDFVKSKEKPFLNPNQQAQIVIDKKTIGYLGTLHPEIKTNWDIANQTSTFVLDLELLYKSFDQNIDYSKLSVFPQVERDLSFWIDAKRQAGDIVKDITAAPTKYVQNVKVVDIFQDKAAKDKKSITIQVTLQAPDKTLKDTDIKADTDKIVATIRKIGGELRGK